MLDHTKPHYVISQNLTAKQFDDILFNKKNAPAFFVPSMGKPPVVLISTKGKPFTGNGIIQLYTTREQARFAKKPHQSVWQIRFPNDKFETFDFIKKNP